MSTTISPPRTASRAKRSGANAAPVNFDPATHPIIARHFFGVEPLHTIDQTATEVVADLRRRRHIQQVHRLGDHVLGELLAGVIGKVEIPDTLRAEVKDRLSKNTAATWDSIIRDLAEQEFADREDGE